MMKRMIYGGLSHGKKQVFISYKSEEFDEALWVKNALEAQGISCWMAPMCITGGASYAAEIPAAIQNCSVFVLVLSEKVQQSKWVPRELDQAINAGKIIMPFMLEDCPLKDEFKFYLSNIQRYTAYQGKEVTMEIMSREIRSVLGIPDPLPEEPPVTTPQSPAVTAKPKSPKKKPVPGKAKAAKKKRWLLPVIIAAVVTVIALCAILALSGPSEDSRTYVIFANTQINPEAFSIEIDGQTITAKDMQVLAGCTNLHWLELTNCALELQDLSQLSAHPLHILNLEGCALTDSQLQSIDFEALTDLNTLNLSNNPDITKLEVIAPVSDTLADLAIGNTGIPDLTALESFTRLTDLSVENLSLETLEPLKMAVYLENLMADGNKLTDLTGLENTTILKTVSLKDNLLVNVDYLGNSAATLERVYLDGNQLESLSCLSKCTAMINCSADRNRLTSLDWAQHWTQLLRLSAADNQITNVALPPKQASLMFLNLSGNQIKSFNGFSFAADTYVTVDLSDNQLTYVKLPENCKFKRLTLHGNPLYTLSCLEGITGMTVSMDYLQSMTAENVKAVAFSDFYIIDCPPNRIVELEQASFNVTLLDRKDIPSVLPDPEFPY